ncbi:MAG: response regulator [Burkholderiales bacterium]|nr:response regulator [Burkholderiales bacterium]MDE2299482.1 response regulator [Burkholderiales bacterium]MDE2629219.1 response regulator [Burkholderiales bacterium]
MNKPRVLIVDDNAINVELAAFVLDAGGFEVDSAADAGRALACIEVATPDVILMDIQMPGVDGLALTRRLKSDPSTRRIVVVAFTAYAMKGDEARMRAAGCDGYLAKPIDVTRFAAQVRACLDDARRGDADPVGAP